MFAEMNVLYHYYFYTLLEISIDILLIHSVAFFMHLKLHYQLSFWHTKFPFKLHNMLSQYFAVKLSCFRNISIAPVINLLSRYTNEQYIVRHFKARPTQIEFGKCSAFVSIFHWLRENTKFSRYHLCYACCLYKGGGKGENVAHQGLIRLLLNKRQSQGTGHICIYFQRLSAPWLTPLPSLAPTHMSWNKFYVHLLTSANNEQQHPLTFVTWLSSTLGHRPLVLLVS